LLLPPLNQQKIGQDNSNGIKSENIP